MRLCAMAFVGLMLGCDKGQSTPPKPAPPPAPVPMATIKGTVTFTTNGPGADNGTNERFSETVGLECTVRASGRAGTFDAKTSKTGAYDLKVPAGNYTLSFEDCARDCYETTPRTMVVDAPAEGAVDGSWNCEVSAK